MKIALATPAFGAHTHTGYAHSIARAYREFGAEFLPDPPLMVTNLADISLARVTLQAMFERLTDADVIVWIDADISFTPEDILSITAPIFQETAHVCAGLYRRKHLDTIFCCEFFPADIGPDGYVGPKTRHLGGNYGHVKNAGNGFLAVSREALRVAAKLSPAVKPWSTTAITRDGDERHAWTFASGVSSVDGVDRYVPEDYRACETLRAAGYDILFSFDAVPIHHSGPFAFQGNGELDIHAFAREQAFILEAASAGKTG